MTACLGAVWQEEHSFGCLEVEQRTLWQQLYKYSCELLAPSMKVCVGELVVLYSSAQEHEECFHTTPSTCRVRSRSPALGACSMVLSVEMQVQCVDEACADNEVVAALRTETDVQFGARAAQCAMRVACR